MQFALVDDARLAPARGLVGRCPVCGDPMIPKCGTERIHHWAHLGERRCDPWKENESQWHRNWKALFPPEWREIVRVDQQGVKHVADVRTLKGLVLEFQRSPISTQERASRELFHQNMVWVVDGTQQKLARRRFAENRSALQRTLVKGTYLCRSLNEVFPQRWLNCQVPVFFDFANENERSAYPGSLFEPLWCLLPGRVDEFGVVLRFNRSGFVSRAFNSPNIMNWAPVIAHLKLVSNERHARATLAQLAMIKPQVWWPRRSFRRF